MAKAADTNKPDRKTVTSEPLGHREIEQSDTIKDIFEGVEKIARRLNKFIANQANGNKPELMKLVTSARDQLSSALTHKKTSNGSFHLDVGVKILDGALQSDEVNPNKKQAQFLESVLYSLEPLNNELLKASRVIPPSSNILFGD